MGKEGGFLTPKAISNRIKAKGLQKLRWYCQVCQKQCRDENGFKCHTMSESHQRQLLLVADNADRFVDGFSKEFEEAFIYLLRRRFGTRRVHANVVYQEYISDRHHTHMNATCWETLTDFVKYLGREGKCTVDYTEKGWFITYIDRDPEVIARQEAKEKLELDDAERNSKYIQQQIIKGGKDTQVERSASEFRRDDEDEKVNFAMPTSNIVKDTTSKKSNPTCLEELLKDNSTANSMQTNKRSSQKRKSALEEIIEQEEKKKKKPQDKDSWLQKGIVVKILCKELGDKFYKKKAVIKNVMDRYIAVVEVLESGATVKIDQADLETVIPSFGRQIMILSGNNKGLTGILESLNVEKYCVSVQLSQGPDKGKVIHNLSYEQVSKLA